jgi:glycine/D-amino acid oxidase-like deaminating enzyme
MMSLMSNRSASTITSTTPFNITLSHDDKKYNQLKKSNNCVKFFSSTDDAAPSSNDSAADANKTSSVNNNTKTRTSLPNETNVCIVGGGIIGTSVAYHLAKLGVEDVILLERDTLTSGTTWHAAGLINTFGSLSGTSTSMRMYTKELYKDILPEETSMDTGFLPVGFIELACDNDRLEYYRRVANFNRFCGIKVEEITPEQVKEKFPLIETNDVLAGFYVEDDGRVNPYDATMALAKGAKKFGAQIYENTFVSGITKSRSTRNNNIKQLIPKVTGVILESGEEIKANVVVNCAGMWARQFGEKCGVSVPNQAAEHYYLITDQMDSVDPSWPVVEDSSKCVYIRPGMFLFYLSFS